MNAKKAIQELEGKFDSHEIWTRAEIQQVLNFYWLEINARDQMICSVTKKELPFHEIFRDKDTDDLMCNCHHRIIGKKKIIIEKDS